ncbi:hypothetical protein LJY25_07060 [Hymenobacter sp. BT175]|uniref:hypothetical protein n=1 Tax=Hymenobacter translucens TaxID=2886507 RepID=UPI001D0E0D3D|nr:hypothetical protein [Hymenobacter translucens]MCC2546198.1 hypothetical protein [Hymenobacter translucens]
MSKHQDKAPTNSEKSHQRAQNKENQQNQQQDGSGADPQLHKGEPHSNSGGTQMQNVNQNGLNEAGNPTKNNTPGGGNNEEQRTSPVNKPRNNPQGNNPMSLDKTNAEKGPGSRAD